MPLTLVKLETWRTLELGIGRLAIRPTSFRLSSDANTPIFCVTHLPVIVQRVSANVNCKKHEAQPPLRPWKRRSWRELHDATVDATQNSVQDAQAKVAEVTERMEGFEREVAELCDKAGFYAKVTFPVAREYFYLSVQDPFNAGRPPRSGIADIRARVSTAHSSFAASGLSLSVLNARSLAYRPQPSSS